MAFLSAMDYQLDCHTLGENGAPELTAKGVGAPLVALFFDTAPYIVKYTR